MHVYMHLTAATLCCVSDAFIANMVIFWGDAVKCFICLAFLTLCCIIIVLMLRVFMFKYCSVRKLILQLDISSLVLREITFLCSSGTVVH